jgi:2-polyprenyl-6-methoxyphenol hydroxylase-like FAD-dependent oxidoreductase
VAGADGLHSQTRALVFGAEASFETFLGCYVAALRVGKYRPREELTYVSHTVPGRHVARAALRDDETLLFLACAAELIGEYPSADRQKEALRHAFGGMRWQVPGILDAIDEARDVYFDRVSQIHVPHWANGRVVLLGDAAACPSLLAGEGTGLAMIEAYVLARELSADGDFARAFAAYDARLRAFVTGKQRTAPRLRGFFVPRSALGLGVRNVIVNALGKRFVAKRFVASALRDGLALPR